MAPESAFLFDLETQPSRGDSDPGTVDQIVSVALAAQVSAWRTRESIASRAARVDWEEVDEILDRVPDVPPVPGDEK
ncbi:MAG: hypothetical protein KJ000_13240 [Pirellulaceae bacterium]|nr:hypothetical protein [Pirellulaceae bacterium]